MWLSEAFDRAFHSIRNNYLSWLALAVINTVLGLPLAFVQPEEIGNVSSPLLWSAVVALILNIMITPGMLAMGLAGAEGKEASLNLIIKKLPLSFKYFGFSIIYVIAVTVGLLALIVPGIYLAARFVLAPYLMIENESLGLFDALKLSGDKMKGQYLKTLFNIFILFILVMFILIFASIIAFFIAGGTSTASVLAQNTFFIIPSSIMLPIIYVGLAVIYRGVVNKL
jgi:hypothetical protein